MIWARHRSRTCQLTFDDLTGRLRALSNTGAVIASHEGPRNPSPLRLDGVSLQWDAATFDIDTARTSIAQAAAFVAVANAARPALAPPSATGIVARGRTAWPSGTPSGLGVSPAIQERERAGERARLAASVVETAAWVVGIAGVVAGFVIAAQEDLACDVGYECGTLDRYPHLVTGIVLAVVAALETTVLVMAACYVQWRIADRSVPT